MKRHYPTHLVYALLLLASVLAANAEGRSGDCSNATHLGNAGYVVTPFDASAATTSGFNGGGGCALGGTITHDLFWTYTAATSGYYAFDVNTFVFGRRISIHAGSDCLATCLESSDTGLFGNHALATVMLIAGQTVLIQVGGNGTPIDSGVLMITALADDCSNPTDLGSGPHIDVFLDNSFATTSGFDVGAECVAAAGQVNQDLFFKYTVPHTEGWYEFRANVWLMGQLILYRGDDCNAECLAQSNVGSVRITLEQGDEILIQVGGIQNYAGIGLLFVDHFFDGCELWLPDSLEGALGNNTCGSAVPIGEGVYTDCNVHALDHDYYSIDLLDGQSLSLVETDDVLDVTWKLYDANCSVELDAGEFALNYTASEAETVIVHVSLPFSCSIYDFDVVITGQVGTTFCDPANVNCSGAPTEIFGSSSDGMGSGLHLAATSGPPGEFGYFLVSPMMFDPGIALSNGRFCLSGGTTPFYRYNVGGTEKNSLGGFSNDGLTFNNLVGTGTSSGGTGFDVPTTLPAVGNPAITSGMSLHFQLWHRDGCLNQGESNFSNGLTVRF